MTKPRMTEARLRLLLLALRKLEQEVEDGYTKNGWEFDEDYENDPDYQEMNRQLSELEKVADIVERKWGHLAE
jgi:hypothetical protein